MTDKISALLDRLKQFDNTAESVSADLRLSFARLVARGLRERGWTQRDLAERANFKESFVSRILHSDSNCTLETAGRLLFALGTRAHFSEAGYVAGNTADQITLKVVRTDGQEAPTERESAGSQVTTIYTTAANAGGSFNTPHFKYRRVAVNMG